MTEELEDKMREILKQNKVKPELWNIRTIMAMESSYRQGYIDAMQEMSRDEPCIDDAPISPECVGSMKVKIAEPVTPGHEPCDKVSHDCHIEYDKVSHESIEIEYDKDTYKGIGSCRMCAYFEMYFVSSYEDKFICTHPDISRRLTSLRPCKLQRKV